MLENFDNHGSGAHNRLGKRIWWSNAVFFISFHFIGLAVFWNWPKRWREWAFLYMNWQIAMFGITMGYHRLWSHRSFTARFPLRILLAIMGTMGFQGSIRWWVLRHRLHHRFTDTDSDPYSASKGLYFSHMGWIFVKEEYPLLKLVDKSDLDDDCVVRFQHKYFIPLAVIMGLVVPPIIGHVWFGNWFQGFLWGGVIARLCIWHSTYYMHRLKNTDERFLINSLAHYIGEQKYTKEVSARGNFLLAFLTNGEGNHNYHHCFPEDFRNGYRKRDWDPTKWVILVCYNFTNQIPSVKTTSDDDVKRAMERVIGRHLNVQEPSLPVVHVSDVTINFKGQAVIVLDGFLINVASFSQNHPGGRRVLESGYGGKDLSEHFRKLNRHSGHARDLAERMRIAKVDKSDRNT